MGNTKPHDATKISTRCYGENGWAGEWDCLAAAVPSRSEGKHKHITHTQRVPILINKLNLNGKSNINSCATSQQKTRQSNGNNNYNNNNCCWSHKTKIERCKNETEKKTESKWIRIGTCRRLTKNNKANGSTRDTQQQQRPQATGNGTRQQKQQQQQQQHDKEQQQRRKRVKQKILMPSTKSKLRITNRKKRKTCIQ